MKKNVNESDLVLMIYKNLTRTLKKNKVYHIFRSNVGNGHGNLTIRYSVFYPFFATFPSVDEESDIRGKMIYSFRKTSNPFNGTKNVRELLNKMLEVVDHSNGIIIPLEDSKKVQMCVLQHINNLLHYCVEGCILDFSLLGKMGKETFDITCEQLFGDGFVDTTEEDLPDDAKKMMQAQMEFLTSDEGRGFRPEELGRNKKFFEFLKRKKLMLEPPKVERGENNEWISAPPLPTFESMYTVPNPLYYDDEDDYNSPF